VVVLLLSPNQDEAALLRQEQIGTVFTPDEALADVLAHSVLRDVPVAKAGH